MEENKYIKAGVSNWGITFADNTSYEIKYLQEENVTHFVNTYNIILKNAIFEKDILDKFKNEIPIKELKQISDMYNVFNYIPEKEHSLEFYYPNPVLYKITTNGLNTETSSFNMYFKELK